MCPEVVSEVQREYPDPEEEEREDEGEEDEVEEEEEDEDKQDYEDDEGSVGSDEDEECENPWKKLKLEVVDALDPLLQKQAEPYLEKGASQDIAAAKAMNDLLPAYRKKLRSLYFKWYRCLKQDPIHRQVIKTLRKFMDEDDMDYEEVSEAAVNKRKFLLNNLLKEAKVPKEPKPEAEEEEGEEEEEEEEEEEGEEEEDDDSMLLIRSHYRS